MRPASAKIGYEIDVESLRPVIVIERNRGAGALGIVLRVLGALALLLLVALLGVVLLFASSFGGVGRVGDDLGSRARSAASSASDAAQRTGQSVADRFDAAHPPRGGISYDIEFAEFTRVSMGSSFGRSNTHVLTLVDVRTRPDAVSANDAEYAVVESALVAPREPRILGVTVFSDVDRQTQYLYKGESFRLGEAYYKVNWVSVAPPEIAVVRYRAPDPGLPLKFELD